jgi:serine/threonine protein kinase
MRFSSPSELLDKGSEERKMQEAKERSERDFEREKITLDLIADLKSTEATGVGNKGDYYSNKSSNVGVKHLARPERLRNYENSLMQEGRMQTMALMILEKARMEQQARIDKEIDPAKKEWLAKRMPARIPFVVGYAKDEAAADRGEASEYIVMETVKGKTLSHLMFQKLAERLHQRDPQKYAMLAGAEAWREDVVIQTLVAHVDELKGYSPDDAAKVIYNSLHGTGLVSEDVALQVGAAVRFLNNAGLFHRDLHERNIMISEDGKQAWIIDFGSAKFDPAYSKAGNMTKREGIYDVGQDIKLWDDQSAVLSLPDLTSNPSKPLKPNARRIKI